MKYTLTIGALFLLAACGPHDNAALLKAKKDQLTALKGQEDKLQAEIDKLDTSKKEKPKLVVVAPITPSTFTHFIDLQGKVESDNISYISPKGNGGQVREIFIKRGDIVHKGQLLLRVDDAIARQYAAQIEQALNAQKAQLSFATSLYEKRKNLWAQNIGTEVDVIKAKTDMEAAQGQVNASEEQVKQAKEQLSYTNITSDVDGQVEMMNVRVGEFFTPQSAATPASQIQIVNTAVLKVTAQVPENYAGRVRPGSDLKILLPDINKTLDAKVRVAGNTIDPINHSFFIESRLPGESGIRPNQLAVVRIQDYNVSNAIIVPVNTLQNDEKGKYVMIAVKENDQLFARKKMVTTGEFYRDNLEIKSGLQPGDLVITDGFQSLYDGQLLTTDTK